MFRGDLLASPARIGCGAGYSGDRIDPAIELATHGHLSYLVFECLAERTIALAQKARRLDPSSGYDPLLEERMEAVLPICGKNKTRILTNMGAANPLAAAARTREIARRIGLTGLRIAAVTGDDVLPLLRDGVMASEQNGQRIAELGDKILSANAYLGADCMTEALADGADVILTGRVADPSLFLAPLIHEFGWAADDWNSLGQGTVIGHLLECAGQVTGGYFADPGFKDVSGLAHLGFPLAEVSANGAAVITKVAGSGGKVSRATCTEQLLYEIQDPTAYITPDVIADFSQVSLDDDGDDRVRASGGRGSVRPNTLKVSVGYQDGFQGEGQISYAGPGALARAQLAQQILAERLANCGFGELHFGLIGVNAIHGERLSRMECEPYEVRLRAAARAETLKLAALIPREVEALYTNGPSGGGGVTGSTREIIAILSTFVPRELVPHTIHIEEA
jgi:hypothetical protein